jgi:hypothetical protein
MGGGAGTLGASHGSRRWRHGRLGTLLLDCREQAPGGVLVSIHCRGSGDSRPWSREVKNAMARARGAGRRGSGRSLAGQGRAGGGGRRGRGRAELLAADGWRARGRRLGKMAARGSSQPWKNHRAERSSPMPGDRRHGETRACREGHHDLLPYARWSLGKGDAMAATEGIGQALPHSCAQLVSM